MNHLRREIVKILFQRRTYVGWAGLVAIPIIMTIALRLSTEKPPAGEGPPFFSNIAGNGMFVPLAALAAMSFFLLPLVSAMTGSYVIAGEAELGTLKTLLTRPVSRTGVLLAKWAVAIMYDGVGGGRRRHCRVGGLRSTPFDNALWGTGERGTWFRAYRLGVPHRLGEYGVRRLAGGAALHPHRF
jgi:hypothetical protein